MLEESLLSAMYSWFTPTVLFVFLNLMIGTIAITSSFSSKSNDPNHPQIHRSPSVLHRLKSINFSSFASPDKTHLGFPPPAATAIIPDLVDSHSHEQPASIEQNQTQPFLSRSPSVLNRIKSFNLYNYISQEPTSSFPASGSPQTPETLDAKTVEDERKERAEPSLDEVYSNLKVSHVNHVARTKSDTEPAAGIVLPKLPKKMKKSASTKSPFSHFEEEEIAVVEARRPATVREGRIIAAEEDGAGAADEEVDAKADDFINRFKQQLKLQRIDSIMRYKETVKKASQN